MTTLRLTAKQKEALKASAADAIEISDDETSTVYLLIAKKALLEWTDAALRRELQVGFDQADSGDVDEWDVDEMIAEAHRRQATHKQ